jgi:hypothetical protein
MVEHNGVIRYRFCYVLKTITKRNNSGSNVVRAITINSDNGSSKHRAKTIDSDNLSPQC